MGKGGTTPTYIDTHAHLTFEQFEKDRDAVLARAWEAGLESIVIIGAGAGLQANEAAIALAETDPRLFATVGIHPHDAKELTPTMLRRLAVLATHEKVVAIGEIGLDYHHRHSTTEEQKQCFRTFLQLAQGAHKPIVIHDRQAHADVLKILEDEELASGSVLFHCFSGDIKIAQRVLDAGHLISIPGIATFPNARDLHEVIDMTPLERMVLETDCPYLAPVPHRGKRNEPAYVTEVAAKIAQIKGLAVEDVARVTTLAAKRFFSLPGAELIPHIAYHIRNSLYLNITNRCTLACRFCPKSSDFEVKGYYLKLVEEPSVEDIFLAMGQPEQFDEVVFCGYGEPTLRLEVVKVIARRMKDQGVARVRLNTDGLANLVYQRNILPELAGLIDAISVSLNAPDAKSYLSSCPNKYGEDAYRAVCDFIVEAKQHIPEVIASVVAYPGLSLEACRQKAGELGVPLRIREYMNVG